MLRDKEVFTDLCYERSTNASIKTVLSVCPRVCVLEFKPVYPPSTLKSLDMGHLHSGMRNRYRFVDGFQAPLFPVTFKSKSISPAPVVLLLGENIFSSSVSDERFFSAQAQNAARGVGKGIG